MSWTWETWVNGRKLIHRKSNGQFDENNFHTPKSWRRFGHIVTKETREKIRETLKGQSFTEKRKKNISKGTRESFKKYSKVCPHGIIPIYKCKKCNSQYRQFLIRKGVNIDE